MLLRHAQDVNQPARSLRLCEAEVPGWQYRLGFEGRGQSENKLFSEFSFVFVYF